MHTEPTSDAGPSSQIPDSDKNGNSSISDKDAGLVYVPEDHEGTNVRMLSACVSPESKYFVVPPEQPVHLLVFRKIFAKLREQEQRDGGGGRESVSVVGPPGRSSSSSPEPKDGEEEETLPFEAFQRAFERLFYLLRDPVDFEAHDFDENGDGYVTWEEFFNVYKERKIMLKLGICERMYLTFEKPESSTLALLVSIIVLGAIMISSLCFILATMPEFQDHHEDGSKPTPWPVFQTVDHACLALFVLEYLLRLVTCWGVRAELVHPVLFQDAVTGFEPIEQTSALYRVVDFLLRPGNIIDLAAIAPGVASIIPGTKMEGGSFVVLRLIRLTRIFRVFKSPAFAEPVHVITRTVQRSTKPLYVLTFQLVLGIAIWGSLMYLVEGGGGKWDHTQRKFVRGAGTFWNHDTLTWDEQLVDSPFESIPASFWWAIVTITTVGYGDDYPTTSTGYIIAVGTMLFSLVILALPVGVVGGNFEQVWEEYDNERRLDKEIKANEMRLVASSMQKLDPTAMSKMMLVQVWNDASAAWDDEDTDGETTPQKPVHLRRATSTASLAAKPAPHCFLGEARLELNLPMTEPYTEEKLLKLQSNNDIVNRRVNGHLTLRYEWKPLVSAEDPSSSSGEVPGATSPNVATLRRLPSPSPSGGSSKSNDISIISDPKSPEPSKSSGFDLQGWLTVTVVSADKLMNVEFTRQNCTSSPYCLLFCYPLPPQGDDSPILPQAWRTPTVRSNLHPMWDASKTFQFTWDGQRRFKTRRQQTIERDATMRTEAEPATPVVTDGDSAGAAAAGDERISQHCPPPLLLAGTVDSTPAASIVADTEDAEDELLVLLRDFGHELRQTQDEIRTLSYRVDAIGAPPWPEGSAHAIPAHAGPAHAGALSRTTSARGEAGACDGGPVLSSVVPDAMADPGAGRGGKPGASDCGGGGGAAGNPGRVASTTLGASSGPSPDDTLR